MISPIPAPGFTATNGKRAPRKSWGEKVWCQLKTGWVDEHGPWLVATTVWVHTGSDGDVVAIRKDD